MQRYGYALLSGGLFGAGLLLSGMTNTLKIQGFLDLFGTWDATLAFVMIGTNDFADAHRSVAAVWANYQQIVKRLESSGIKVVVVSTLPCHTVKGAWKSCGSYNSKIRVLNTRLARLSGSRVTFLDLWPVLVAGGNLRAEFTFDGIHLNGNGYQQWKKAMAPFMPVIAALPAR